MSKNISQFFTVDLVTLIGVVFLLVYVGLTKNILDVCYLFFMIICYVRIKYSQWKKYH